MGDVVTVNATAKINLRLRVLAREESGYHSLETLLLAVSLADDVALERTSGDFQLEVNGGIETGPEKHNLAYRAATEFARAAGLDAGVSILLRKRIPSAAGLGGGSSDAAAVLRGMQRLFPGALPDREVLEIGGRLGNDVPFFLTPTPFALAWGWGERLLSLPPPPSRPVLIASPGVAISTADAFARLAEHRRESPAREPELLDGLRLTDWDHLASLSVNDFYAPALELAPMIRRADEVMRSHGARPALLTGSGATFFGVFETAAVIPPAVAELERIGFRCWTVSTLTEW